jgi:hypothetical protein
MVTRKTATGEVIGPEERVSLLEAFRMFSRYAAYATGEESIKGRPAPGMLADLVVLEKDPWACPPDEIGAIGIHRTIVGSAVWGSCLDCRASCMFAAESFWIRHLLASITRL